MVCEGIGNTEKEEQHKREKSDFRYLGGNWEYRKGRTTKKRKERFSLFRRELEIQKRKNSKEEKRAIFVI